MQAPVDLTAAGGVGVGVRGQRKPVVTGGEGGGGAKKASCDRAPTNQCVPDTPVSIHCRINALPEKMRFFFPSPILKHV